MSFSTLSIVSWILKVGNLKSQGDDVQNFHRLLLPGACPMALAQFEGGGFDLPWQIIFFLLKQKKYVANRPDW